MSPWLDTLLAWLGQHPQWLGMALLIVCFIECLAVVGLLIPGTVLLFALSALAGSGPLSLGATLALAFIGGLLGDLASYALGRRYHQDIRRLRGLRDHPEWLQGAEAYVRRYGTASLLIGRFVGPLRPMLPLTAGMLDMPFGRFFAVSLAASAGWSVAYLLPGWATGAALRLPLPAGFWPEAGLLIGTLAAVIGLCAWLSLRGTRLASPLVAGLCGAGLLALFVGWPRMVEFDQGLMTLAQQERSAALDRAMVIVTLLGDYTVQVLAGLLLVALLLLLRQWRFAGFAGLSLLGTALANGALKDAFARLRPDVLLEPLTSYSFPSGHSSAAFALCLTLGVLAGREQPVRLRLTWLLLACLPAAAIALSRVYLGVHWPTDVLAGALLAAACCALSLTLIQWRTPLPALPARAWRLVLPASLVLLGGYAMWLDAEAALLYRYR